LEDTAEPDPEWVVGSLFDETADPDPPEILVDVLPLLNLPSITLPALLVSPIAILLALRSSYNSLATPCNDAMTWFE